MDKEQFLEVYRHSLSHILAKAVIEIYGKEVQYGIGPQIADGCYYDFVLPVAITEGDFKTIENKMREIIKRREAWRVEEVSKEQALEIFKDQRFKTELIQDLPEDEVITVYYTGDDFVDLCRGPHIDNSQLLMNVAFQVRSVSGAYWRGDEHRDQMQRVYLYAFPDQKQLKEHLKMIKEAMERDHKKLGPQLELFMFTETAQGMPYWLPRGWKLYQALMQYSRDVQDLHEYEEISAPVINNNKLWIISGHWAHYVNNMFIIPGKDENDTYTVESVDTMAAKPMNCPNAMMEFKRKPRSYKELPIRYSEYDVLHRKEKTGQLNGLLRVQEFRQDDDHTFVTEDMIEAEIDDILSIADEIYKTFGITYRAEFSTRPDDFMGDIKLWDDAEAVLKKILDKKYGAKAITRSTKATALSTVPRSTCRSRTRSEESGSAARSSSTSSCPETLTLSTLRRMARRRFRWSFTARSSAPLSASSASSLRTSRVFSRSGCPLIRSRSFRSAPSTMSMPGRWCRD